jgi:hypothetical protein
MSGVSKQSEDTGSAYGLTTGDCTSQFPVRKSGFAKAATDFRRLDQSRSKYVLVAAPKAPTEGGVVALQQAILSHALLPRWHQAIDLHQKVTTENPTAVFVS